MAKKFFFITTNKYKFEQFKLVVKNFSFNKFEFKQLNHNTVEIQANDNEEVASYSSWWASHEFNCSVIKEDVGFYINSLNGFPGPYLSQIEKQIKSEGFINLLNETQDRTAFWQYSVSCCHPNFQPITFSAIQHGNIARKPRGKSGWFADKIFIPSGKKETISELLDNNKYERNNNHYKKLLYYLLKLDN